MVKRNAIATKLTKRCTQTQKRAFDVAVSILLDTFWGHTEDLHRRFDTLRVKWVVCRVSGDRGGRLEAHRDSMRTPEGSRRVMGDVQRGPVGQ